MLRIVLMAVILLVMALPAAAQQDNLAVGALTYGDSVTGTLTQTAFFELWTFSAQAGDAVRVGMIGSGGLAPLVGLLDPNRSLIANSPEGEPNTTVSLEAVVPDDGTYTLVATRAGRDMGTSAGEYVLSLALQGGQSAPRADVQAVTFRCQTAEIAAAAVVELSAGLASEGVPYRLNVYGLDGFQPYVRITSPVGDLDYCRRGSDQTGGDVVLLPGEEARVFEGETLVNTFELFLETPNTLDRLRITIGSQDSAPGRYMAVLSGLSIDQPGQTDVVTAYVGPLAAAAGEVLIYAVGLDAANSRLDPYVRLLPDLTGCDDAGRRGCEQIPSVRGAGLRLAGEYSILGDRFDAGVRLRQADLEGQDLEIGSFSGSTSGAYALFVIGTLPPR
jgi:hypothetical protein